MQLIKGFALMIQFLTRIPVPIHFVIEDKDFAASSIHMPFVGLLVGACMALGLALGSLTPYQFMPAILAVAFQMLITGVFHLDGLGDTFDGLFSNKPRHRILEIMRDSRIGTNGAATIFFSILLKVLLITELFNRFPGSLGYLLVSFMPAVGKIAILTSAALSVYARPEGGLGKSFINGIGLKEWLVGTFLGVLLVWLVLGPTGIPHLAVPIAAAYAFTKFVERRIGGMTGDTLGAANEIGEILYLVLFANIYVLLH